jgi:hypothetical protein
MSLAVPAAPQGEPGISVPGARGQVEALMDRKGAEPGPAADWMIASIGALARQAEEILASEGIACDRGLACYWRQGG